MNETHAGSTRNRISAITSAKCIVNILIDMRKTARANKDYATSDQIRNKLVEAGIQLKDSKEGTTWSKV